MPNKVIVIGLGAATFDLLIPWANEGKLPAFKKILDYGCYAGNKIPVPSSSATAWATFLTGKLPGDHGVYGYSQMGKNGKIIRTNSRYLGKETLWTILSNNNLSSTYCFIPLTYPLPRFRGRLIPGVGVPNTEMFTTWPKGLKKRIRSICGIDDLVEPIHSGLNKVEYLKLLMMNIKAQIKTSKSLLSDQADDLFVTTFTALDRIQCYFWDEIAAKSDEIYSAYKIIDDFLQEIMIDHPSSNILIVSDNGAGPIDLMLHMNNWLKAKGFLKYKRIGHNRISGLKRLNNAAKRILPARLREIIKEKYASIALSAELPILQAIDWRSTNVFSICERFYFNRNVTSEEKGVIINGLIAELKTMSDPRNGKTVIEKIIKGKDIFRGQFSGIAPELDYFLADNSIQVMPETVNDMDTIFYRPDKQSQDALTRSGNHRHKGIFMAFGPEVRHRGPMADVGMIDMLPTILHMLGLEIPDGLNGKLINMR